MIVIGLTGGIGAGKSTISGFLAELGAAVIDADKLGHELYLPHSEGWQAVVDAFGSEILNPDGHINRPRLGQIVFNDPDALKRLNGIMHPRIYMLAAQRLEDLRRKGVEVAVLEAAILIEANWTDLADQVWVVVAPEEVVVERVSKKGMPPEQIRSRIRAQMSVEERIKWARVVIYTDGSLDNVRLKVRLHWQHLMAGRGSLPTGEELKERIRQVLAGRNRKHLHDADMKRSAILMPLFEREGNYYLVFTRRTDTVKYHKGQISFPGGTHEDKDRSEMETALRECEEEIGLKPEFVEVLGELDDMRTTVSSFIIAPFVGLIPDHYDFKLDPVEVKEVICIPLEAFWKDVRFWMDGDGQGFSRIGCFFDYHGQVIWGATGKILKCFLDLLLPPPPLND